MLPARQRLTHSTSSSTLADILERVLDAGVVLTGDVKIKIVDIELLSIQVRLILCSVDKAREMGLDWWMTNPEFCSQAPPRKMAAAETPPNG
jgi:gas vesicle protein GvpA/GvpJ/GvpM family